MTTMNLLMFLVCFPLVPAVLLALIGAQPVRTWIVRISATLIAIASIWLAVDFGTGMPLYFSLDHFPWLEKVFFGGEIVITLALLYMCRNIKKGEWWIPVLILGQAAVMAYLSLTGHPEVERAMYVDSFSVIMALIIGIIGSLITVYALSYMKDYHHHHTDIKDRTRSFFFILFFFLSAMFGIVFSNNLIWLYLFWEITTMSSFVLIGYSRTEEATRNAYRALGLNALGGLGFVLGIFYLLKICPVHTVELDRVLTLGAGLVLIPAILISFAGLAKAAQMPFSSWLLGAMVAPTPVSALLHSSTMVKAGVFIIIKFAPVLSGTLAGYILACVGGVTFLMTSLLAITQSNAKRVLAYSTIANLGLIVMCAGVGSAPAIWAAILLVIFHAVAKGLLFLTVGSIEHKTGSRDIEDMEGLIANRPFLAAGILVGILGMFLAPFGMLISKWACLEALQNVGNFPPVLTIMLAFGSAATLFFWAKWMGKVIAAPLRSAPITGVIGKDEQAVLFILIAGTVLASVLFPVAAAFGVDPYVQGIYGAFENVLGKANLTVMMVLMAALFGLPIAFALKPHHSRRSMSYLAGANVDKSNNQFVGSMQVTREVSNKNYYFTNFMTEASLTRISIVATILLMAVMFWTSKVL